MRFTLIGVNREKDGLVDGWWLQDFTGTLEEATQCARETEKVNSDRITVAVIEDMYYTPYQLVYGAKRLDVAERENTLEDKITEATERSEAINQTTDELIYGYTLEEWNSFSAEEQEVIQDRHEYTLQHPEQAEWFID